MTREEREQALEWFKNRPVMMSGAKKMYDLAIEALSADGDTISRQAAIDSMTNTLLHYPNECYRNLNEYEFAKGLAELGLKSVPPAQPEIIRCKDCQHYKAYDYTGYLACHLVVGGTVRRDQDDFCSRAERREDD